MEAPDAYDSDLGAHLLSNLSDAISGAGNVISKIISMLIPLSSVVDEIFNAFDFHNTSVLLLQINLSCHSY